MNELKDAANDAEYTRLLVGKWRSDELSETAEWHHVTIFNADGTWLGFGAGEDHGESEPFFSSGTWFVQDSRVHTEVEKSPMLPTLEGMDLSYLTLSVSAKEWVWKNSAGQTITSRRVDAP
ncbi:hypothetical protein [Sorangium cellulosum]|uniref:Lipocalin-like domain-containing protein n=1 Tax=Sorangium cellulosum So0157-2 TaxID=1254432 RepID=S4XMR7_SORCE|nr:hypothetical protein [Sorangium cellulosum]AGP33716.1 hypothetical protein SCE1572_03920 [Sorangium cellulosum So0157-2]